MLKGSMKLQIFSGSAEQRRKTGTGGNAVRLFKGIQVSTRNMTSVAHTQAT